MPAPTDDRSRKPRREGPSDDLSAVPAFLRQAAAKAEKHDEAPAPNPPVAAPKQPPLDPASLPFPMSRRRLATIAGALVAAWLVISFGRQVGDASAASTRADDLRAGNAELRAQIETLQSDLGRVQASPYIGIAGRGYGLGGRHEVPFSLGPAPSLAPDAPGSASVRLGAAPVSTSPIDEWLDLLIGSGH
jgi:hypothetical protein